MALERMAIVKDYSTIRHKCVIIVGVGGVGSVAAEMLARCGIGKLILYDYDRVEAANMNRLFYRPDQCGMSKVVAAASTLCAINPDVDTDAMNIDVTTTVGYAQLQNHISGGGVGGRPADLLLSCVDNYGARIAINRACLVAQQAWMESGVSEDAVAGHIQTVLPGRTACFECVPPLVVASGIDERTLKRDGVCAASLPTTMGVIAGLLAHNALKYLLAFGQVTYCTSYNSLTDNFYNSLIRPSSECRNATCVALQADRGFIRWDPPEVAALPVLGTPVHDDNDWNIECTDAAAIDSTEKQPMALNTDTNADIGALDGPAENGNGLPGGNIGELLKELASLQQE